MVWKKFILKFEYKISIYYCYIKFRVKGDLRVSVINDSVCFFIVFFGFFLMGIILVFFIFC